MTMNIYLFEEMFNRCTSAFCFYICWIQISIAICITA